MKSFLCLFLGLMSPVTAATLEDYRWKKRLLVVTDGTDELAARLARSKDGLAERDLEVFVLRGPLGIGKNPAAGLEKELQERLKVVPDVPEVILLGKDGRTVLRWRAERFTVDILFAAIDAMPMRRQEMNPK